MNEDKALRYVLTGFFALIVAAPLLAFWKPPAWARIAVIATMLLSIAACWRFADLDTARNEQLALFVMTLIPPSAAALVAGIVEIYLWQKGREARLALQRARDRERNDRHERLHARRYERRSRSASGPV